MPSNGGSRRVRVERGIYRQENGRFAVCVMVERRPRFRTIDAGSLSEARVQRETPPVCRPLRRASALTDTHLC